MAYSDKVLDHYENPRNVGKLDDDSANVGTGMVGAPACGDVMRLQIEVGNDGVIQFLTYRLVLCIFSFHLFFKTINSYNSRILKAQLLIRIYIFKCRLHH